MKQFDIVENLISRSKSEFPYLLVLQHGFLDDLKTVVVAPIRTTSSVLPMPKLSVEVAIGRKRGFAAMHLLGATEKSALGKVMGSAGGQRDAIVRAYDIIIAGV